MPLDSAKTAAVCGATGRQGGAVARHLLARGWQVRALTRNPEQAKARALGEAGAEVVRADMGDRNALADAFAGADGVFSVQNPMISGVEAEVAQGRNVAAAAQAAGVDHLVYGSAGIGEPTGVPSWDSKVAVEGFIRELGLPATILRPMAFMELMTDKGFYPALAAWSVMPKLMGPETKVPWVAVDDVGAIAAEAFGDPQGFVGRAVFVAADVRSLAECRALWQEVRGRRPRRVPIPVAVFERLAGRNLTTMWRWCRSGPVPRDTSATREIHPGALTVREWLESIEGRSDDGG